MSHRDRIGGPDRRERLNAFREKVKTSKHVKFWTTAEGLAGQVALTFNRFVKQYEAVGWIRADRATSSEALQALADARAEIVELRSQLGTAVQQGPTGTEDLSQGSDKLRLGVDTIASYTSGGVSKRLRGWVFLEVTWNDLLGAVGPVMLFECEQEQLRTAVQEWILVAHWHDVTKGLDSKAREQSAPRDKGSLYFNVQVNVDNDDLGTILIQFKALGIITYSDRKRSVSDTGTYWKLTPYGETQAIKVRALRRPTEGATRLPGAEDREGDGEGGGEGESTEASSKGTD